MSKTKTAILYNPILEMTYHQFCHILLITQTYTSIRWETLHKGVNTRRWGQNKGEKYMIILNDKEKTLIKI